EPPVPRDHGDVQEARFLPENQAKTDAPDLSHAGRLELRDKSVSLVPCQRLLAPDFDGVRQSVPAEMGELVASRARKIPLRNPVTVLMFHPLDLGTEVSHDALLRAEHPAYFLLHEEGAVPGLQNLFALNTGFMGRLGGLPRGGLP